MAAPPLLQHRDSVETEGGAVITSDEDEALDSGRGSLFRAALRGGGILFAIVLALGLYEGVDPVEAFLRALAVLLALAVCGWLAEQFTRTTSPPHSSAD
jgi:hypothetical protein